MNNLVILTEHGKEIGTGHFHRGRIMNKYLSGFKNYKLFHIALGPELRIPDPNENLLFSDVDEALNVVTNISPDLVIIDCLNWSKVSSQLKLYVNTKTLTVLSYLQDVANFHEGVGLLPGYGPDRVLKETLTAKVFAGYGLTFIKSELCISTYNVQSKFVTVFLGGTDPFNLLDALLPVLRAVSNENRVFNVFTNRTDILSSPYVRIKKLGDDYFESLQSSKYAIINGGNTRYDCLAAGLPSLALSIHKIQFAINDILVQDGFMQHLGVKDTLDFEKSKRTIVNFDNKYRLLNIHKRCRKSNVNGKANGRKIREIINQLLVSK